MIVKYNEFILEHMDMAKSIISRKMEAYEKLKVLLKNNLGYIGKFTQFLMEENIPYQELENLFKELSDLKSKNASFDLSDLKYEKVLDKIEQTKIDLSVKSVINQFPSEQKKMIKEMSSRSDGNWYSNLRNILHKISQKENIGAFMSKISRYKEKSLFYNALKIFCKDSNNKKEEVLEQIKNSKNSKLVYNDKNWLIIHIGSYEDIKLFGSDTSWCIVSSNSTYTSYTRGRNQFVLYNYDLDEYDPKFKIGFTLNRDFSIHAAHDILDGGVKSSLRGMFESKELTFQELFKREKKKVDITLDQITPRTNNGPILDFAGICEDKDIVPLIKKLISFRKSTAFKQDTISALIERLYDGRQFIYEKELIKIDPKILDFCKREIEKRIIKSKWEYGMFNQNYENWEYIDSQIKAFSDTELLRLSESDFSYIACRSNYRHQIRDDFNREVMTRISDRINALARIKPLSEKLDHFFVTCLLFNASLGRKEQTPHYQEVSKMVTKSMYSKYYYKILNLPIDASETYFGSDIKPDMIPLIVKKDYDSRIATIDFNNLEICDKIVEHLKGYKVAIGASAKVIRWYSGKQKENSPLLNVINQFQVTKLRKGQEKTVGDITIRVI